VSRDLERLLQAVEGASVVRRLVRLLAVRLQPVHNLNISLFRGVLSTKLTQPGESLLGGDGVPEEDAAAREPGPTLLESGLEGG